MNLVGVSNIILRMNFSIPCTLTLSLLISATGFAADAAKPQPGTMAQVLADSKASDWRDLDPENTLYFELPAGRVVIELAPDFAPQHVANVKALAREKYFDGLAILRCQDNYVVQCGDPDAEKPDSRRNMQEAKGTCHPHVE